MGIFVGDIPLASVENRSDYGLLGQGSWYDAKPNALQKSRIPKRTGFAVNGDDLLGMILSVFTDGASPDGSDGPKPIVPTSDGKIELCLGQRHVENFRWGGFHSNILRQSLRIDFAKLWNDALAGKIRDSQHPRRVLDAMCEKYKVDDWKEFVPQSLQSEIPGRLPHETTINDTFDRADSGSWGTSSDGTWSWNDYLGSAAFSISSNQGKCTTGVAYIRADSDLSSADHYAQADVASDGTSSSGTTGVIYRKDSTTTQTMYRVSPAGNSTGTIRLFKIVSGTQTQLGSDGTITRSGSNTMKGQASGSTITAWFNGSTIITQTDTAVTGNLRTGCRFTVISGNYLVDNFQASDLAASGILYTQLERSTRGLNRGMYTRWG